LGVDVLPAPTCSAAPSFVDDDAIIGLAQPLAEAPDQFASGIR
jgi:hypothetical protein